MPSPAWEGHEDAWRTPGSGAHALLAAPIEDLRAGTASWVGRELAAGSKVYYKGWLEGSTNPEHHWIVGPWGAPGGREAIGSGQLEFLDYPTVIERCGGTNEGLFRLQLDEVEQAFDEGWGTVAMTQETSYRPMLDAAEATQFAGQERAFDLIASRWPVNTLCQLSLHDERDTAVWESMAVHHRDLQSLQWSARILEDRWYLSGELDVHVAREFGAAVHGALRSAWRFPERPDLEVDLAAVSFLDTACAQIMMLAARSAARYQRMILRRVPPLVREVIEVVGRPRSVFYDASYGVGLANTPAAHVVDDIPRSRAPRSRRPGSTGTGTGASERPVRPR